MDVKTKMKTGRKRIMGKRSNWRSRRRMRMRRRRKRREMRKEQITRKWNYQRESSGGSVNDM